MKKKNNLQLVKKNSGTLCTNKNLKSRETSELKHVFSFTKGRRGIRSVNVTSDNRYLIITFEDSKGIICIADLKKLEFLPYEYKGHAESVRLTSITRDNKAFYTASWDGSSRRFDIESGKCTKIFGGFGRSPSCFIDPEQKYLFTASYDSDFDIKSKNNGRCWDPFLGKTINMYKHTEEREKIECIDITYDKGIVYTGSDDGIAYKWNLKGKKPILKYFTFKGSIRKIAVSNNYFAAACTDGFVRIHNKFSGKYFQYFFHGKTDVRDVRISKNETKFWSAAEDGTISCFNLHNGKLIYHKKPHSNWIWSICLMNNENILVTGSSDGSVAFLSADSGQILARLLNLPYKDDFVIACPPDKTFPTGFFYTTNKDFIEVVIADKKGCIQKKLDLNDPKRRAYINKLNLKNLVITRLKGNRNYDSLTDLYIRNQKMLSRGENIILPKALKA
jgi:WD40 repeat protein